MLDFDHPLSDMFIGQFIHIQTFQCVLGAEGSQRIRKIPQGIRSGNRYIKSAAGQKTGNIGFERAFGQAECVGEDITDDVYPTLGAAAFALTFVADGGALTAETVQVTCALDIL